MLQTNRSPCPRGGASAKSGAAPGPATSLSKNTGLFGQEAPGEVGLSGRRGEIGNHEVAGKSGVITLAALPRNPVNAVKSRTWRRFSLSAMLQRSARRTLNLSKDCRRRHLFFARPLLSARLLWRRQKAQCPLRATVFGRPTDGGLRPGETFPQTTREHLIRAETAPTVVASGRTVVRAKAAIQQRARRTDPTTSKPTCSPTRRAAQAPLIAKFEQSRQGASGATVQNLMLMLRR
jgi:hypothetical protein